MEILYVATYHFADDFGVLGVDCDKTNLSTTVVMHASEFCRGAEFSLTREDDKFFLKQGEQVVGLIKIESIDKLSETSWGPIGF